MTCLEQQAPSSTGELGGAALYGLAIHSPRVAIPIEQILICLSVHDIDYEAYYFRTRDGFELDLVLRLFGKLWAFEIKLSSVPDKRELDRLTKTAEIIGADTRVLVSRTPEHIEGPQGISTNLAGAVRLIMQNK